jgi:hypothetical protein
MNMLRTDRSRLVSRFGVMMRGFHRNAADHECETDDQ